MEVDKRTRQELLFRTLTNELVEVHSHLAPHKAISPRYRIGRDHVWRVEFDVGEVGWVRGARKDGHEDLKYFVPPAVAHQCRLREARSKGLTLDWANNALILCENDEQLRDALLMADSARYRRHSNGDSFDDPSSDDF